MLRNVKLQTKLLAIGILATTIPLAVISAVVFCQNQRMVGIAETGSTELVYADLDHITRNIYEMCRTQQANVNSSLNIARALLESTGKIQLSSETVAWDAVNQQSNMSQHVELPKMMIGSTWLGQITDMRTTSPVVDQVQKLVGGTCAIFQRMDDAGDMLRVCTNVPKQDGSRAIGTYLPRIDADGRPNPVIAAVLQGQTYRGQATVMNRSYFTAYEPILDQNSRLVGMLYVGIPQESMAGLREAIMAITIGNTGYVYVLDSKGNYVISAGGKRDGECIWEARDANGSLFIQEICRKALALKEGEIGEQRYPWKNEGDAVAREKIARIIYFQPWDWVIGVGSYMDEICEVRDEVVRVGKAGNRVLLGVLLGAILTAVVVWYFMARGITGKIHRIVSQLSEGAEQVASASDQVSAASQSLAEGATEQAAGLEETSSSLEEMSSMTKRNADNAEQANSLATEARKAAATGGESMSRMNAAIHEIQKSSDETAKIIKVIDEIAFQTNLLALNAAVEAARAGEAGKGFAVVAEEVRNLAMRSAEAAKNTASMIEESVKNSKNGVDIATEVSKVLEEIVGSVGKTTDLVSEIAAACQEQAQGIDQVNTAVSQMDKVTQQNAANAEESASASEELSSQAESMNDIVAELVALAGGASTHGNSKPSHLSARHRELGHSDHVLHAIAEGSKKKEHKAPAPKSSRDKAIPLTTDEELNHFNT